MEQIADYRTVELLGEGSSGKVWLCAAPGRLETTDSQAVVKLLTEPTTEERFELVADEVKLHAAANAKTPHLVRLFEVGFWDGYVYLAMEYAPHGSLRSANGRNRDSAVRAVAAAARGVHGLHEQGVTHRAVKPSNILLINGAGKACEPGLTHLLAPRKTLSGVGAVSTVEFMEQGVAHGEPPSRASDIWSLGACLQFALTGTSLYGDDLPHDSVLAMLRYIFTATVQPSPKLDRAWSGVVGNCIAADRADRYPTAEALAEDIERVYGQVGA